MRRSLIYMAVVLLAAGCATMKPMQVKITRLGQQVPEAVEKGVYMLPQTVLKVQVQYQELRSIPGPFRDYAEKYLGIKEVIRQNNSEWKLVDVQVKTFTEMDPTAFFQVHQVKGTFDSGMLKPFMEKGVILDGSSLVQEEIREPELGVAEKKDYLRWTDQGTESNFAERTETMYKTIVTDTSFVEVPVDRTITEEKSPSMKAHEAADFILELRIRRFELLTGEYDSYPQGEAMKATLEKLDQLEASYLSLFIGKTLSRTLNREWFLVPDGGSGVSDYPLGTFSIELGFVPSELMEGKPLHIRMVPQGLTAVLEKHYSEKEGGDMNRLYYRVPDVVDLSLMLGTTPLGSQRLSIYQSGTLISSPLK